MVASCPINKPPTFKKKKKKTSARSNIGHSYCHSYCHSYNAGAWMRQCLPIQTSALQTLRVADGHHGKSFPGCWGAKEYVRLSDPHFTCAVNPFCCKLSVLAHQDPYSHCSRARLRLVSNINSKSLNSCLIFYLTSSKY